jgi:hypothetical protein
VIIFTISVVGLGVCTWLFIRNLLLYRFFYRLIDAATDRTSQQPGQRLMHTYLEDIRSLSYSKMLWCIFTPFKKFIKGTPLEDLEGLE